MYKNYLLSINYIFVHQKIYLCSIKIFLFNLFFVHLLPYPNTYLIVYNLALKSWFRLRVSVKGYDYVRELGLEKG